MHSLSLSLSLSLSSRFLAFFFSAALSGHASPRDIAQRMLISDHGEYSGLVKLCFLTIGGYLLSPRAINRNHSAMYTARGFPYKRRQKFTSVPASSTNYTRLAPRPSISMMTTSSRGNQPSRPVSLTLYYPSGEPNLPELRCAVRRSGFCHSWKNASSARRALSSVMLPLPVRVSSPPLLAGR